MKMLPFTAKAVKKAKVGRLAFEADSLTVSARDSLATELPKVELISAAS
jgi:hypothetical protein